MASPGKFTKAPEWWRHLRGEKRTFWKAERKAAQSDADTQAIEAGTGETERLDAKRESAVPQGMRTEAGSTTHTIERTGA